MPVSEYEPGVKVGIAVTAQSLYLINLLLVPGLAFLILLVLYAIKRKSANAFTLNHLQQTVFGSLWAGFFIIAANVLILLLGGYEGAYTWVIAIVYFTIAHSSFIILGMIGLVKALAGQCWSFPLIGRRIPDGC